MSNELCPACETPMGYAPGIGPFCPNRECPVDDGPALWDPETRTMRQAFTISDPPDEIEFLRSRIAELEAERDAATRALGEALEVRTWTEAERKGMAAAFKRAGERHGHYETLFAVGEWLLRHRAALAKAEEKA